MGAQFLQCASIFAVVLLAVVLDLQMNKKDRTLSYQLRRLLNWLTAGGTYVVFYMARYAIVIVNTESGRAAIGTTPTGYGALLACGFWAYAAGTALGGGVVDRIGGRKSLLVGACGCCVCCTTSGVLLLLQPMYWALLLLNMCNLAFATLGALSVIRINVDWYTKVERGTFSGIFGIMISTGYFVALGVGGWILASHGPAASFFAPAVALACAVPCVAFIVADRPADVQCVDLVTNQTSSSSHKNGSSHDEALTYQQAVVKLVRDPLVRATMLGLFGTGWVREGFLSWFGSYLQSVAGIEVGSAGHSAVAMAITLGGMTGSLTVGLVSDRCCGSKRAPVVLGCTTLQVALLLGFPACMRAVAAADGAGTSASVPVAVILCGILSAPLFGALTLLMAAASVELVEPALSGTASGLLNAAQNVGSGISTIVSGALVEWLGWDALFGGLALGAGIATAGMAQVMRLQREARSPRFVRVG